MNPDSFDSVTDGRSTKKSAIRREIDKLIPAGGVFDIDISKYSRRDSAYAAAHRAARSAGVRCACWGNGVRHFCKVFPVGTPPKSFLRKDSPVSKINPDSLRSLDLAALRRANDERAAQWTGGNPLPISFAMMELAGEVGEACNAAKKIDRSERGMVGGDPDLSKLADELADVVICADLAASRAGIDLAAAVAAKFNATSAKHGFLQRL